MLQAMQTKVAEEGETEKELYERFQCYCKNNGGTLGESIAAAEAKAPAVGSEITTAEEKKTGLEAGLSQDQDERVSAKKAMAEATEIREKEAAAFAATSGDYNTNIQAIKKAVTALEKGATGFLQTSSAQIIRKLAESNSQDILDEDRQALLSFLSGAGGEGVRNAPQSG